MKMVSLVALAAAALTVATPAVAQKKGKEEQAQLKVSDEFRKPAAAADTAIKAKDWATAETQLAAAEAVAKNDDERYFGAVMRLQVEANKKNGEGIVKALDVLLASPKTPPASLPLYNYYRGSTTFELKKRAESLPFLLKARQLGHNDPDLPLMLAQAYFDANDLANGATEMTKAMDAQRAAGKKPPEAWYEFVIARLYKAGDRAGTADWFKREIAEYPSIKIWRRMIMLYRESFSPTNAALTPRQKLDLFRMMRATGALADQSDYLDYAEAAVNSGLPWEAVSAIDEGRKSGKLPSGDAGTSQVYASAQGAVKNEGSLDALAKTAASAATGKDAAATADAFLASTNYARALELYDLALQKGSVDTNAVNLHRGVALLNLGRMPEAKQAFSQVQGSPLGDIARLWVAWIDMPTKPA